MGDPAGLESVEASVRFKFLLPLMAGASLVTAQVAVAQAMPVRATAAQSEGQELAGVGGGGIIVGVLAFTAVLLGVLAGAKNNSDRPNSP
jgi:hypothetical protein